MPENYKHLSIVPKPFEYTILTRHRSGSGNGAGREVEEEEEEEEEEERDYIAENNKQLQTSTFSLNLFITLLFPNCQREGKG